MSNLPMELVRHQLVLSGLKLGEPMTEEELGTPVATFVTRSGQDVLCKGKAARTTAGPTMLLRAGGGQAAGSTIVKNDDHHRGYGVIWEKPSVDFQVDEAIILKLRARPGQAINRDSWILSSVHPEERAILIRCLENPALAPSSMKLSAKPILKPKRIMTTCCASPDQTLNDCRAGARNICLLRKQSQADVMVMLQQVFTPDAGFLCDTLTIMEEAAPHVMTYVEHLRTNPGTRTTLRMVLVYGSARAECVVKQCGTHGVHFFMGLPSLSQASLNKFALKPVFPWPTVAAPGRQLVLTVAADGPEQPAPHVKLSVQLAEEHSEVLKRLLATEDASGDETKAEAGGEPSSMRLQPSKTIPLTIVSLMVKFMELCAGCQAVRELVHEDAKTTEPTAPWCAEFEAFAWTYLDVLNMGPRWLQLVDLMELAVYLDITSLKLFCRSSMITEFQLGNLMERENATLLDAMLPLRIEDPDSRGKRNRNEISYSAQPPY